MTSPKDDDLTKNGLALDRLTDKSGRILLIACGALAREILDLRKANNWSHMDLTCLPANLHLHPEKITPAVRATVEKHQSAYDTIFVVYADCGTSGLLQAECDALGVEMVKGPHCYSFFEGNQRFERLSETEFRAFYLTDFLVRQFDAFVWKPMGLDRHPELRTMYFGNYETLIYQAQTDDPALVIKAKDCADRLGLRFEHRKTGYGDLETTLATLSGVTRGTKP